MKKILLIILTFFALAIDAKAIIDNECINNQKCLVLCNYKTDLYANQKNFSRDVTIYYNFEEKDITVRWQDTNLDANIFVSKKTGAVDYVFSNSGSNIYWGGNEPVTLSNFSCPQNGYLDTSDLNGGNEICFDDDGTTCKNKYSNVGTAFAHHGGFVSEQKDYDVEDHIRKYSEWIFGDIKDEISNGTFDIEKDLVNKINKDFKVNFLYGNDIPEFIVNSEAYKSIETNVIDEFNKAKAEAEATAKEKQENDEKDAKETLDEKLTQAQLDLDAGTITSEEYQKRVEDAQNEYNNAVQSAGESYQSTMNNWNVNPEIIQEQTATAFKTMNMNITWLSDFNVSEYCESYLGNPQTPGKPAYYLQFIFNLIKYAAIIMLIVLSIVEYGKAVASSNQDAIKKASTTTVKRLIIVVIIFLLPELIKFLLTILGAYSPGTCGIS